MRCTYVEHPLPKPLLGCARGAQSKLWVQSSCFSGIFRARGARRMFVGQGAGSRKGGGGMAQREQKAVLADFRRGAFNTLVATCIGEEGLDIPQVPPPPCSTCTSPLSYAC